MARIVTGRENFPRRLEDLALAAPMLSSADLPATITGPRPADEACAEYVLAVGPAFQNLRQTTVQLAGLLVLAACGSKNWRDHPMLALADDAYVNAKAEIESAAVPAEAAHHNRHLKAAARSLGKALHSARTRIGTASEPTLDAVLDPLKRAQRELQWTSAALPGFETVDFAQACCSNHLGTRPEKALFRCS